MDTLRKFVLVILDSSAVRISFTGKRFVAFEECTRPTALRKVR
jgi:hypothetical protein